MEEEAPEDQAEEAEQLKCSEWLLRIEEDLHDSSLTFQALSWAISCLRSSSSRNKKRKCKEERDPPRGLNSIDDVNPDEYGNASLLCADSVRHGNVQIRLGGHRKKERRINIHNSGCEGDGSKEYEAMLIDDEEEDLIERVKLCGSKESTETITAIITEKLKQYLHLVSLIEQCLLLSLDQKKPSCMKEMEKEQGWLLSWLLKDAFCNGKHDLSSDLDWLLAYLSSSSTCIDLFYLEIWEIISAEFLLHSTQRTMVPLSTLARVASVLEYTNARHGELAASSFLSSYQLFTSACSSTSLKGMRTLEQHEEIKSPGGDLIGFWLMMGFLCPGLFSSCINLLTATFNPSSMRKWWFELQNCDFEILPLHTLGRFLRGADSNEPSGLIYWICTIFRRNLAQLITADSNVVLALCNICTDCCQTSPDMIQMVHQLLNIISNKAYGFMLQRISGCTSEEVKETSAVFENIKCHMINLWSSLFKERSACIRPTEGAMLCERPIIHMYLSTLICCPTEITAQVLVYSAGLVYSRTEETNSIDKLGLLFKVMQVLANTAVCEDVFELWADKLIGQVCTLTSDQAFIRILLVANLLQLSSGKDLVSAGKNQGVTLGPSIAMHHHLLRAFSRQWLPLLALLHWEKAWELRLMVVRVLQFLPPEKLANMQDIIFRLKGSVGLFFKWLDEAYGCKPSEKSITCLSEDWNDVDEKWQFIQLIENLKSVIVQLACSSKMTFTLMANSVMEYSFHKTQGSLSEMTNVSLWAAAYLQLKTKVDHVISDERSPKKSLSLLPDAPFDGFRNQSVEPLGCNSVEICLISSHLGNLLRQAIAQISKAEQLLGKNAGKFGPMSVLAKLLVNHLQTPHEVFASKEKFEEAYPKNAPSCDQIFLSDCFSRNPLLFEILEIILEHGDDNETEQCMEFLRAMLAYNIAYWNQSHPIRKNYCGAGLQGEGGEFDRMQVCRLIQMIRKVNGICSILATSAEIISLINRSDIPDLLQLIWNSLHHRKSRPTPTLLEPADNDGDVKEEYFTILRRNIAVVGPLFASIHCKLTS